LAAIVRAEEGRPHLAEDKRKEDQGEARQAHQREQAADEQPLGEIEVRWRVRAPEGREACCLGLLST